MHPLSGSNPATLAKVLMASGGVPPRHWGMLAGIVGSVIGRTPFTVAERILTTRRLRTMPEMPPPVFILGHWRSGTTHLYNVMSRDPALGFLPPLQTGLPWEMLTLVKMLRPMLEKQLPEGRYIDNVAVTPDSPQEDEIALANMHPLSYYHALYFPKTFRQQFDKTVFLDGATAEEIEGWRRAFLLLCRKLTLDAGGRRLVIKNPVYTARVALLREIFPDARFVHVHRDPVRIFSSMRNFYQKLFPPMALQDYSHVDIDGVILDTYSRMMDALLRDTADLPANRYTEVAFDDLERDPVGVLERVYTQLDLPGFAAARQPMADYIDSISGYRKNAYRDETETARLVARHWRPYLDRWGYSA